MADDRFRGLPRHSQRVLQEFCDRINFSELSDVEDLSDDERGDPSFNPLPRDEGAQSEDSSEEDEEPQPSTSTRPAVHRNRSRTGISPASTPGPVPTPAPTNDLGNWVASEEFEPLPPAPWYDPEEEEVYHVSPINNFQRYIPDQLIANIAQATSANILATAGIEMALSTVDIKKFIGITIKMACYKLPRIKMYWAARTRVAEIADTMPRNKYFLIRNNLRVRDYASVPEEEKNQTKYWKVSPLLQAVRNACLSNVRSLHVSIDEQMVPFHGTTSMRQRVKGKPNPVGLKNFVACSPDGLPLDFFLYEGKGDSILPNEELMYPSLDSAGKVVVRLSRTLHPGALIYMDRFFNSIPLLDELHLLGFQGTGTLKKDRIPKTEALYSDAEVRGGGRGFSHQVVREDGQVAVIKWFDNKPVVLASSVHGTEPKDKCRRWNKTERQYIEIDRPVIVKNYNIQMGGVDLLDRMMSYYRIIARTKKWTVRLTFHMVDFVIAAGWIHLRRAELQDETPRKDLTDLLQYKTNLADQLSEAHPEVADLSEEEDEVQVNVEQQRRVPQPLPSDTRRTTGVLHMPELNQSSKIRNRCRFPGCDSTNARFFCTTCKVWLCITQARNCYTMFHTM